MIGNLTYNQIEDIALELENAAKTVDNIIKNQNIEELEDFISTVEGYSKYLKTTVELNKDADKALEELKSKN